MLYSFSAKLPDTPKKSVANGTGVPALKSPGAGGGGIAVRPAAVLLKPEAVVAGKPTVTSVSPKPLVFKVLISLNLKCHLFLKKKVDFFVVESLLFSRF